MRQSLRPVHPRFCRDGLRPPCPRSLWPAPRLVPRCIARLSATIRVSAATIAEAGGASSSLASTALPASGRRPLGVRIGDGRRPPEESLDHLGKSWGNHVIAHSVTVRARIVGAAAASGSGSVGAGGSSRCPRDVDGDGPFGSAGPAAQVSVSGVLLTQRTWSVGRGRGRVGRRAGWCGWASGASRGLRCCWRRQAGRGLARRPYERVCTAVEAPRSRGKRRILVSAATPVGAPRCFAALDWGGTVVRSSAPVGTVPPPGGSVGTLGPPAALSREPPPTSGSCHNRLRTLPRWRYHPPPRRFRTTR